MLGKTAGQLPDNYERGELLVDTAMDLETNATTGLKREASIARRGSLADDTVVAQTFAPVRMTSTRSTTWKMFHEERATDRSG